MKRSVSGAPPLGLLGLGCGDVLGQRARRVPPASPRRASCRALRSAHGPASSRSRSASPLRPILNRTFRSSTDRPAPVKRKKPSAREPAGATNRQTTPASTSRAGNPVPHEGHPTSGSTRCATISGGEAATSQQRAPSWRARPRSPSRPAAAATMPERPAGAPARASARPALCSRPARARDRNGLHAGGHRALRPRALALAARRALDAQRLG